MDEENPPPSRPYRIRRASSSLISSTTSPMFSAPAAPQLQPPPSPMAHHSRHRPNNSSNNNGAISQNVSNNNNFGPGDIDDDVQPSSSSSSFPPPSPRPRVGGSIAAAAAGSSSSFNRNSGPQSPLSSPDSTFWGGAAPSPSPVSHSYRGGPSTPGGMCVVSSSTVDDVPPSPFSPAEDISNSGGGGNSNSVSNANNNGSNSASLNSVSNLLSNSLMGPVAGPSHSGSGGSSNGGSLSLVHNRISQLIVGNSGNNPSVSVERHNNSQHQQQHSALISQLNQEVNHGESSHASTSSSSSSHPSSLAFNISPLRNKIKKASSFERFSQAQAASIGGRSSGASAAIASNDSIAGPSGVSASAIISNQNSTNSNEQPISLPLAASANSSSTPSASSAIVSRISWEPVTNATSSPSTSQSSSSSMSSFRLSQNASFGDKSHIKIPSKKLAAKIASVFEQEQLNEAAMASASASVTNVIIPSTSTGGGMSSLSHHHQGTSSSSSPIVQSYLNSSSSSQSQSSTGSNSNANSTLSQILNEAPAHHLSMGSLVSAAEEQIMSQGGVHGVGVAVSSHENLIRELSESPLNLAESSSSSSNNSNNNNNSSHHHSNHHHSHSQSQSILPHRNPVISSRASLSNSSSSASTSGSSSSVSNNSSSTSMSTFLSKKIPLTPKQKLLHRIQSGTMSPPIEPQPPQQQQQQHQQQHQQQQVLSIHHQMQQVGSPPQSLQQQLSQQLQQQQASISSALSSIQSSSLQSANLSLVQEQLQHASNGNGNGGHHLILSSGGPHSPNSQLDAYSYEAMLRQREDLAVQEAIGKIIDDPNNVNNMPYDAPEAYAYYQSILSDDIFPSGGSSQSTSRSMQQQMSGNLQDPNDSLQQSQHQGQIEFVLGLPGSDEHDRNRADDLSLGNDGGQQQFLDPNDALAVIKSHNQTDSTLRNLLMMDPSRHTEDAWLLAEYQNPSRLLTTDFNNRSSTIRNGMVGGGGNGSNGGTIGINSTSVLSINGIPTSIGTTSWNNDSSWQRASLSTTTWQHQAPGDVSVDQDEVMDMSMMEPDKPNSGGGSNSGSNSIVVAKRISQLHAAYGDQSMDDVNLVSDRDLANGLPLLQNMPISMPMDLQQPLGLLQSSSSSANSLKNALNSMNGIPMDLQHHKILSATSGGSPMDMDDQPVNLMAVNLEQELSHHSNSSASMSHHHHAHQQQHSAAHLLPHHLAEVKSLSHSSGNGNEHSSQQNGGGSYTIQMHQQSQHIPNEFQQHHSQHQLVEVGDLSPVLDNIDERRVIRVKKNKDNMPLCQDDVSSGFPPPNFIPDKPVQPKSYASLPSPLQLVKVGNGDEIAVFTRNKSIPPNTRFGPVEGSLKKACASDMDTMNAIYPCLILTDHNNILWRVNRDDDDCCNWMKFVRMAHSIRDQNALVSDGDHDGLLYFTTCKEIPPRTELQVGFSFEYAQKYGLPYLLPMPNSSSAHGSNNSLNSGMLDDDEKMTISSMQQQSNAIATVIQGGSQNFLQQQHQQLQKSLEESMIQNHHDEELQQHEQHQEHEHHHHHQQQQHHQQSHSSQSTSSSPETTSSVLQQPQQKSVIVESFPCFECDQEFHDHSSLQQHLDKMHKEPEIRRPKKKAIKKYQQSQQSQQNSAVSTTAHQNNNNGSNSSGVTTGGGEVMDVSFSFSTSSSTTSERISDVGTAVVAKAVSSDQSGKVDSSSQSNAVDSSDPLSMGNLPMTKKRKAASSINAMNAKSLSSSTSSTSSSSYSLGSGVATTTMSNSSINTRSSEAGPTPAESLEPDTVVSNSVGGNVIGGSNMQSSNNTNNGGVAPASAGGVSGGIMNTSVNSNNGNGVQQVDGNDSDVTASQPPAKVKCTMCYKSFATKERLDRHMIVHSDEDTKPLKCPFCPKRFLTNSALAGHIKTHAEEGKCFECPMCNFSTPQLLQLKEHVQTHKNRDSGMFHCPQCPKKFSAYSMIRKHIRAFHGPRQYECEQCPMSFPTADKLKLHKLKHSDHREFLCAECGRQFKRKDKLREHTKRIHETKRKAIELTLPKDKHNMKKFIPKVSPEEYERFIYKCSECMVGFKRRGMLVNHLAKRHPEKPPQQVPELNMPIVRPTRNYFCLYCERVYKSSSKRKAHIIKAHPGKAIPPQARCKDIPTQLASFIDPQPLQPGTIVQTLTDDGNNTARAGVVSSAVSSTRLGSNAVSTSALAAAVRRETVVGKVVAQPHGCQWCHRQYATRAKLLQHQRKAHIHLMPADMQMPRTQKNNVMRKEESSSKSKSGSKSFSSEQDSVISSNVTMKSEYPSSRTPSKPVSSNNVHSTRVVTQSSSSLSSSSNAIVSSSGGGSQSSIVSTPVTTTTTTLQALQAEGLPFQTEEGGLVGILVTPVGSNVELGNLVQGDVPIVMLATQAVNGSSATASALSALQGVNFSVLQAGQVTNLSSSSGNSSNNNGTNASPNIISISNNSTTGNTLDTSSPGNIITISTGSGNSSSSNNNSCSVARIANVIQHHQSSSSSSSHASNNSNSDNNNGNNGSSTSSSSGVISATGKL